MDQEEEKRSRASTMEQLKPRNVGKKWGVNLRSAEEDEFLFFLFSLSFFRSCVCVVFVFVFFSIFFFDQEISNHLIGKLRYFG